MNIPPEVIEAAHTLESWAIRNGLKDWKFAGIASRGYAERLEKQLAIAVDALNDVVIISNGVPLEQADACVSALNKIK